MNLLIVDDEQIEREGMEAILKKSFPNAVIMQAKNGMESIEIAKMFQPDIVLMDIKMPGMNGLKTIEKIQSIFPNMKFILVTAYDTFDFARQAIRLGVKDYLLKPSKAKEITDTVRKVFMELEEERRKKQESERQREQLQRALSLVESDIVTQLLFDHVHEVHIDFLLDMVGTKPSSGMFVVTLLMDRQNVKCYAKIKKMIRLEEKGWVGPFNGNQVPMIIFRNEKMSFRSQAVFLAKKVLTVASSFKQELNIGIGSVCCFMDDVRKSYQDSLTALIHTKSKGKYRFYSDVSLLKDSYTRTLTRQLEKEFQEYLQNGHIERLHERVMDLVSRYEMEGKTPLEAQQGILEILWVISRRMSEIGLNSEMPYFSFHVGDYRQLRAETTILLEHLLKIYKEHFDQLDTNTILDLKEYVLEHSHEDISLETLSNRVGLSPIYISRLFKEKIGTNYIDFLTDCRIEKAKKLLKNPDKSVKEIAIEVGYHDPNYFSKVFKKVTSQTPKEYRISFFQKMRGKKLLVE